MRTARARLVSYLVRLPLVFLILAGLGPLVGRATLAQTIMLVLLASAILYFFGDLVLLPTLLRLIGQGWSAVVDGLIATLTLRTLAPMLGAAYSWGACLILGAVLGVSELFLHHWEGARVEEH